MTRQVVDELHGCLASEGGGNSGTAIGGPLRPCPGDSQEKIAGGI